TGAGGTSEEAAGAGSAHGCTRDAGVNRSEPGHPFFFIIQTAGPSYVSGPPHKAMSERKQTLNVAMIGNGFIGRVHSTAFHQVGHFFKTPYDLHLKVVCGRDRPKLEAMAAR